MRKMMNRKQRGFSLVEMLVVIAIMAILSIGVMTIVGDSSEKAKMATAMSDFAAVSNAIQMAKANGGTITIADGKLNAATGLGDAETYLSGAIADFPDEYEIVGDYLQYMESGALKTFDFGDGRGAVDIKKKIQ